MFGSQDMPPMFTRIGVPLNMLYRKTLEAFSFM